MNQKIEYKRSFSLFPAYQFLKDHALENEAIEIKASPDQFKSYTSTLRRAKIVALVKRKNLLNQFLDEVWPSGKTKRGISRVRFFESLNQRFLDSKEGIEVDDEDDEENMSLEETQFAYETDLRDYLASNLHLLEIGLRLYKSPSGESGVEYKIPNSQRRIDILAIDKNDNYVVIELKVSRGHEKTIGQALYYQSMVKSTLDVEKVRIILIAREVSEELKMGTKYLPDVELFEYQLSLTLNQV